MTTFIFTGPTLSPEEAARELEAIYLPPVSQGDVYRVSLRRPRAIGIIDGYFERVPAVWHKEILWALSQGIHVFGSASIGALRAAELAPFGMEGVGAIFEAYRDGVLEDDDEVALVHGPAETGYVALSEPMVNIRSTLEKAGRAGVLSPATCAALERIAKDLFYPERSYPRLLRQAAADGLPGPELAALEDWLLAGQVNQKRDDALAMLRTMRERLAADPGPKRVDFRFEHTEVWDQLRRSAGELHLDPDAQPEAVLLETLLDELRLEGAAYPRAWQGAMARLLAIEEAHRQGVRFDDDLLHDFIVAFRRERGLLDPSDVERWIAENRLTRAQFIRLMEDEARFRWAATLVEPEIARTLPDHLRISGDFARLAARARDKQRLLASRGLENPDLADLGLTTDALVCWYFEARLGRPVEADLPAYLNALGFASEESFRRAVLREFCYLGLRPEVPAPR